MASPLEIDFAPYLRSAATRVPVSVEKIKTEKDGASAERRLRDGDGGRVLGESPRQARCTVKRDD